MNKTERIRSMKAELAVLVKERTVVSETAPGDKREQTIEFISNKIDSLEKRIAEAEKTQH